MCTIKIFGGGGGGAGVVTPKGFDKIKQGGRVMVLDQQSAEKLYNRLRLEKSDGNTYRIAFENESGTLKDILSPGNRWLAPKIL